MSVVLTVIDEDVLNVEYVFTIATVAGKLGDSLSCIPDRNFIVTEWCKEIASSLGFEGLGTLCGTCHIYYI